jgi:very-short-patch-repair endonuclease
LSSRWLVAELAGEQIDEELRLEHDLVVVNPDGFQGDERDVIYFSLSYDAKEMSQAALSARQAEREHLQGMLNVAFTRARDEIHVFHSAPIAEFGMASGRGAIRSWLEHCADVQSRSQTAAIHALERTDSEFEAQVIAAVAKRGVRTVAQYPSCGFFIDIVAELEGERVAVECDGEIWHLDEHGRLRAEDLARQEILERAGWRVLRIPYRGWLENPDAHVDRVLAALGSEDPEEGALGGENRPPPQRGAVTAAAAPPRAGDEQVDLPLCLSAHQAAVVAAMKQGATEKESVLRLAREQLGHARLGSRIRASLEAAIQGLRSEGHIHVEDGEMFLTEATRSASISTYTSYSGARRSNYRRRRRRYY